ncbi:glutamic-type intramembrane protease PrsW [Virgibacillus sp. LDC-1]|uniref:glutamic-type intramembrane protease PrsW n=1 Tax=Virgibacillus sp. LDC-1 TaxID=3039856 RepID=UPI0024DE2201|nr:glutamic-type intramembrane protease PrsW [Virgibacillus sp. LDC-1]
MFAILSAGIAPAFALLSFFYLKDRFTEPLSLIVRTFIFGMLLVFPIMFVQYAIANEINANLFVELFFLPALLEEFFKWFIFFYVIYGHTEFDAHYDGIVYAVSISLGFATLENILFLFVNGIEYAFTRAIFPVSSHALFAVIMGYHFGKAKMYKHHQKRNLLFAFLFPFFLHGIYNYILNTTSSKWLFIMVPFMIILWMLALHRMKSANKTMQTN